MDKHNPNQSNAVTKRVTWNNHIEFVLSCMAIGVGSIWRFPYLCYKNGGGAFLIAYIFMVLIMGLPIFFLELVIGQYSGFGPDRVFSHLAPIFSGLGYCAIILITLATLYYMIIMSWTVFYLFASFSSELGWGLCSNDFNTENCYSAAKDKECLESSSDEPLTFWKSNCTSVRSVCEAYHYNYSDSNHCLNVTSNESVHLSQVIVDRVLSSEEYFNNYVLGINGATWENFGLPRWRLVLCLLFCWIFTAGALVKGIKSSGRIMYFNIFFPFVVLLALLIRGSTLDGAENGVLLYIIPRWELLLDVNIWGNAASQTFYAFGIGYGSLITLSSFCNFNNNCHRDVLILTAVNIFTSIFAGFSIFTILGYLAYQMDVPVEDVARDGPGLAFVAYPEAVLQMPLSQLWAVVFFLMLLTLGLGAQFSGVEALITGILDTWPKLRERRAVVTVLTCSCYFLLSLPMCCNGGMFMFSLLEWNTASWQIFIIGLAEVGVVAWSYGGRRFLGNVEEMGIKLPKIIAHYWWICLVVLTPLTLIVIFILTVSKFTTASLNDYVFPDWANAIGWLISMSTLAPLLIFAAITLYSRKYTGWNLLKTTSDWGPSKQ